MIVSTVAFEPTANALAVHKQAGLALSGNYESEVAIASAWSGGGGSMRYGISWQDFVAPTTHGIRHRLPRPHERPAADHPRHRLWLARHPDV